MAGSRYIYAGVNSLIAPVLAIAACALACTARQAIGKPATGSGYVVSFPADRDSGRIKVRPKSPKGPSFDNKSIKRFTARGVIRFPRGYVMTYEPSFDVGVNLHGLLDLDPEPLVGLDLAKLPLKDKALKDLDRFYNLEDLTLKKTDLNDTGLAYASELPRLWRLNASSTMITAAGVKHLVKCRSIRDLVLECNQLTDKCSDSIAKMTFLRRLNLKKCDISDVTANRLAAMSNLKFLCLSHNRKITSKGLQKFYKLKKLKELQIQHTSVTPDIVNVLKQMPSLRKICVSNDKFKKEDVSKLRKTLPRMRIEIDKPRDLPMEIFAPLH